MNGRIKQMDLYIRSMGKLLKVEAVFGTAPDDIADANAMMERHERLAVVAECDGLVILADKHDQGPQGEWAPAKPIGDYVAVRHTTDSNRHTMAEAKRVADVMNATEAP